MACIEYIEAGECTIKFASVASVFASDFYVIFLVFYWTFWTRDDRFVCCLCVCFFLYAYKTHASDPRTDPKKRLLFFFALNIKGEEWWQKQQRMRQWLWVLLAKGHTHTHTMEYNIIGSWICSKYKIYVCIKFRCVFFSLVGQSFWVQLHTIRSVVVDTAQTINPIFAKARKV